MIEYIKNCLFCEKEFKTTLKRQKCCSDTCYSRWYSRTHQRGIKKTTKECYVCGKKFTPYTFKQVTCGSEECQKKNAALRQQGKRVMLPSTPSPLPDAKKEWNKLTPSERWERMSLTELSGEIAKLYPGKSFGQVRLLKEQGMLPKDFGRR